MENFTTSLLDFVALVATVGALAAINVLSNYLNVKKSELSNKVQTDKIANITGMVDRNIQLEVESGMIRIRNAFNAGSFTAKEGPGSAKESIANVKKEILTTVKNITAASVVTYLTNEHIEDFDKWVEARIEYYVTQQINNMMPESMGKDFIFH